MRSIDLFVATQDQEMYIQFMVILNIKRRIPKKKKSGTEIHQRKFDNLIPVENVGRIRA